mmetsp:Transcript_43719/g.92939  ORF Transcript_43719/g.92939 Transcript_43719/m.92939 type:complete len:1110 (-) Transcript_43719:217-3546(-)|eukprot:CAMPEP_0172529856 /NCGR_PEP_ID=MMETSP1067-20121228/3811_1 /TAXON_ID=265564 ORGANISM="Thalassiosira punctigera, Strain Tpunct2005C2" /NCGR_SAMPLE_ID=MMETSP1067 /ASSEMBLY_ACC=CAM_ASM_000444 /LENGTH=1109 /DNA_ID=CAMNT_0013313983 /DNA_START=174 /DNA_END=3503 /DNA_ORIENTATION=+
MDNGIVGPAREEEIINRQKGEEKRSSVGRSKLQGETDDKGGMAGVTDTDIVDNALCDWVAGPSKGEEISKGKGGNQQLENRTGENDVNHGDAESGIGSLDVVAHATPTQATGESARTGNSAAPGVEAAVDGRNSLSMGSGQGQGETGPVQVVAVAPKTGRRVGGLASGEDLAARRKMMAARVKDARRTMIAGIMVQLTRVANNLPSHWLTELPQVAKSIEAHVYRLAQTFEDYIDSSTLKQRLLGGLRWVLREEQRQTTQQLQRQAAVSQTPPLEGQTDPVQRTAAVWELDQQVRAEGKPQRQKQQQQPSRPQQVVQAQATANGTVVLTQGMNRGDVGGKIATPQGNDGGATTTANNDPRTPASDQQELLNYCRALAKKVVRDRNHSTRTNPAALQASVKERREIADVFVTATELSREVTPDEVKSHVHSLPPVMDAKQGGEEGGGINTAASSGREEKRDRLDDPIEAVRTALTLSVKKQRGVDHIEVKARKYEPSSASEPGRPSPDIVQSETQRFAPVAQKRGGEERGDINTAASLVREQKRARLEDPIEAVRASLTLSIKKQRGRLMRPSASEPCGISPYIVQLVQSGTQVSMLQQDQPHLAAHEPLQQKEQLQLPLPSEQHDSADTVNHFTTGELTAVVNTVLFEELVELGVIPRDFLPLLNGGGSGDSADVAKTDMANAMVELLGISLLGRASSGNSNGETSGSKGGASLSCSFENEPKGPILTETSLLRKISNDSKERGGGASSSTSSSSFESCRAKNLAIYLEYSKGKLPSIIKDLFDLKVAGGTSSSSLISRLDDHGSENTGVSAEPDRNVMNWQRVASLQKSSSKSRLVNPAKPSSGKESPSGNGAGETSSLSWKNTLNNHHHGKMATTVAPDRDAVNRQKVAQLQEMPSKSRLVNTATSSSEKGPTSGERAGEPPPSLKGSDNLLGQMAATVALPTSVAGQKGGLSPNPPSGESRSGIGGGRLPSAPSLTRKRYNSTADGDRRKFPFKLLTMLEFTDVNPEWKCAISWYPDGQAFFIKDRDKLCELLPRFFQQTKFRSFTRQLNLWGFNRILPSGWWSEYFVRGSGVEVLGKLTYIKVKGGEKGDGPRKAKAIREAQRMY